MKIKLEGEYCIPGVTKVRVANDHVARYVFASRFVRGKKVLDIACGTGYGTSILAKAKAQAVDGVDTNKDVIRYATTNYPNKKVKYIKNDLINYQPKEKYDVIVCFETIEHIKDDKKALTHLYTLLNDNGELIISSPNRMITSPDAKSINDKPQNPFHVREYTVPEFTKRLKNAGFNFKTNDIFGQRLRIHSHLELFNRVYRVFFKPDDRGNSSLRPLFFLTPRYFVVHARKNTKRL